MGDLTTFTELIALEVRGVPDKLQIVLDAPLDHIRFVNFEAVELVSVDQTIRRPRASFVNPVETFSYVPNSEVALNAYTVQLELELETSQEIHVVPYEQYKRQMKQSQMATFYGWSSLLILRLHNCHLDQLDAEVFDGLTSLIQLSLDHNRIKVIPAFTFYGMPNLRKLSLSHNEILNLNYRDLAGLLNLRELDLSYNNLTKLSELTFPPFPKLKSLDMRFNDIQHIFPYTFDVMNGTEVLLLGDSEVEVDFTQSTHAFHSLHELRKLTILNASHPKFSENIFFGLYNLQELNMQGRFPELTFDSFGSIPNITEITLSRCAIETLSMDTFYSSELLEVIDLSNNRITYLPPNLFDRQFNLRELYMQHNLLSTLPNLFFAHTTAKVIRLTDNPWICNCDLLRTWRQGVTNSLIKRRKETHCQAAYNDPMYTGHESEVCREKIVYNIVYDNKLSPRCDGGPNNVKHRSVYYVYRRDLKCREDEIVPFVAFSKNNKGFETVTVLETDDKWAKAQHAKKIKIMDIIMAKKKEAEKMRYRHTNSIVYAGRKSNISKLPHHNTNSWPKKIHPAQWHNEQDNTIANQLEL